MARLNAEELELRERLAGVERETASAAADEASANAAIGNLEREQLSLIAGVTDAQTAAEASSAKLTEAKVELAQLREKRAALVSGVERLRSAHSELADRLSKLESSIRDDSERAELLRQECDDIEEELAGVKESRREKAEALAEGRTGYEGRMTELQVAEVSVRELRSKVEKLTNELNGFELKLGTLEQNREHLLEGVHERYGIDLVRHLGDYHLRPITGDEEEARLNELRRLIDRMGADINLTAIEEYAEISERHEFLSAQEKDLTNAVGQLGKSHREDKPDVAAPFPGDV